MFQFSPPPLFTKKAQNSTSHIFQNTYFNISNNNRQLNKGGGGTSLNVGRYNGRL